MAQLVAEGMPTKQIASTLNISPHTVNNYLFRIYNKTGLSNRVELTLYMQQNHPAPKDWLPRLHPARLAFKRFWKTLIGLTGLLAVLLTAQTAEADEIYTYVGNPYSLCSGAYSAGPAFPDSCNSTFRVQGSFTTSLGLPSLENLSNFTIPAADITAFSFTDGSGSIASSNAASFLFNISTNAFGEITSPQGWDVLLWGSGIEMSTSSCDVAPCIGAQDWTQSGSAYGQTSFENPGAWSAPIDPAPTPEPATLSMFGIGLLLLRKKLAGSPVKETARALPLSIHHYPQRQKRFCRGVQLLPSQP